MKKQFGYAGFMGGPVIRGSKPWRQRPMTLAERMEKLQIEGESAAFVAAMIEEARRGLELK